MPKFNSRFQFLGIPPKGEPYNSRLDDLTKSFSFSISRDPPEGGTFLPVYNLVSANRDSFQFLGIPPKGEPLRLGQTAFAIRMFSISRDPPEGGTVHLREYCLHPMCVCFQFLGIPPKGELYPY